MRGSTGASDGRTSGLTVDRTRTGSSATTPRPVPSTATATPSGTTPPTPTGSRCRPPATAVRPGDRPQQRRQRHRPRRPAAGAAQRHGPGADEQRQPVAGPLVPLRRRRRLLAGHGVGVQRQPPHRGWRPAHQSTAVGRDRRRLRHRAPLHRRHRHRPLHLRQRRPRRPHLLLLSDCRLHELDLPAQRRVHLLNQRRRQLGYGRQPGRAHAAHLAGQHLPRPHGGTTSPPRYQPAATPGRRSQSPTRPPAAPSTRRCTSQLVVWRSAEAPAGQPVAASSSPDRPRPPDGHRPTIATSDDGGGPGGLHPRGRTRTGLERANPVHGADGKPSGYPDEARLTIDIAMNVDDPADVTCGPASWLRRPTSPSTRLCRSASSSGFSRDLQPRFVCLTRMTNDWDLFRRSRNSRTVEALYAPVVMPPERQPHGGRPGLSNTCNIWIWCSRRRSAATSSSGCGGSR